MASGCDDFVRKPFEAHIIFEKIANHLGVCYRYRNETYAASASPAEPAVARLLQIEGESSTQQSSTQQSSTHQSTRPIPLGAAGQSLSLDAASLSRDALGAISTMSVDWLRQFYQAAIAVDAEELHALIEKIPKEQSQLADKLTYLTQNFCFDELVALTQTYA